MLLKPLRPLDKRTMEEQRTIWEIQNYSWTTKWTVVFIFTQWDQQISAIKGPTGIPGAQVNAVVFCIGNMDWIIRKSSQMQEQGCLFQNGAQETPSHHNTLHSTGRDSDKAETMCPQDFRTKHFYFPQKRVAEQPFSLASKLRNSGL